ncbi:MAG: tetratricopeptide repeat protein [Bacteroidales bacterium]|nr:tetratricopeptide repeat protein [Bacteroidales bacterium]
MRKKILSIIIIQVLIIQLVNAQRLNEQWLNYINQGKEKYKINSYKSALELFQKASKIIPTDTTAFVYIIDCALKVKMPQEVDEALDNLKFLGYIKPDFYEIAIASSRDVEENYNKAFEYAKEAKESFPDHLGILFEETKIYYKQKDYDRTIQKINNLIQLDRKNQTYHQFLIHIYIEDLKNYEKALEAIIRAQNDMPDLMEFQIQEADIYIRQKDFNRAQQKIEQLIQLNPNNPKLYYNLALIFFEKGDYATSAEICKKALEYDPNYYEAIYNVGTFYYYEGLKYNAAISDMTVEQYTYDNQGRQFEQLAKSYFEEAKPYFEKAIKLNPDELDAYENLNTINVLLNNLESLLGLNIPQTQKIAPDSVVNAGQPLLFINNLSFDYPNATNLINGDEGFLNFEVENLGNKTGKDLHVVLIQPVIIPGLIHESVYPIDSLNPGEKTNVKIPVKYQLNDAQIKGIERIEGTENKLRLYVRELDGYNADLVEFKVKLSSEAPVGDATIVISDTEDIEFSPIPKARNFFFILAIDKYENWPSLHNAVKDATRFKDVLLSKYQFDEQYLFELYDQDATHENIRNELIKIKNQITANDNLIIYYAGHGDYDPEFDDGAWIPVDAHEGNEADYIPNVVLLEYLKKLETLHTFLIADACFSGSLFIPDNKLSYEPGNDKLQSRWAFSSGNLEYVADGAIGEHSPFAGFLIESLEQNKRDRISTSDIIGYVKFKVKTVSDQTPVGKPLKIPGNKGGEFVFYTK